MFTLIFLCFSFLFFTLEHYRYKELRHHFCRVIFTRCNTPRKKYFDENVTTHDKLKAVFFYFLTVICVTKEKQDVPGKKKCSKMTEKLGM